MSKNKTQQMGNARAGANWPWDKSAPQLNMFRELIVDNFAGHGGASLGIEFAAGRPVDIAINHDINAIRLHKVNHPYTVHYQEDVWDIDPQGVCNGHPVGLAWFSPTCTHFSKAKGLPLVDKHIRGLAWVTLRWLEDTRPRAIIIENVEEFKTWGPLMKDPKGRGMVPDPARKGETFEAFIQMLTTGCKVRNDAFFEACEELKIDPYGEKAQHLLDGFGYDVEYRELTAADYGAATTRKRLFIVGRCDGVPIVWPEPTHARPESEEVKTGKKKPWRAVAEVIDWSLPVPSVFDDKKTIREKYDLIAQRPLAFNTMRRIARGLDKFVLKAENPYIVPMSLSGGPGQSIQWTVTNTTNSTGEDLAHPLHTLRTSPGGGQMLMGANLVTYHTEQSERVRGQAVTQPLATLDTSNRHGLVVASISEFYSNNNGGADVRQPLHTVMSSSHHGLQLANLTKFYGGVVGADVRQPCPTITAIDHNALMVTKVEKVEPGMDLGHWPEVRELLNTHCGYELKENEILLLGINGGWYYISDIGLRMLTPREQHNANGFPPDFVIDRDYMGQVYTKSEQTARCGNSVPPPFATALVRALFPEWCGNPINTMAEFEDRVAV